MDLAKLLRDALVSPNVSDSNMEPANIVDVIDSLGRRVVQAAKLLGNNGANTSMGALEAHGKAVLDGCADIASAIRELADRGRQGEEYRPPKRNGWAERLRR